MSELIAIPLESDRRAVAVLAALRRLQAEYQSDSEESGAPASGPPSPADSRPGQPWRAWRRGRFGALTLLVGSAATIGATVAAVALLSASAVSEMPSLPFLPGDVPGAVVAAAGVLLVAAAGVLLGATAGDKLRALRHRELVTATADAPKVSWLVSYLMRDGAFMREAASPGAGRMRASILQVTLPADAEGRLKAILARADAATAR